MQNLTSKLQFHGFLFSRKVVSTCSWWQSHHCICLVFSTFYLFRLMSLVHLSQGLHATFFYTCLPLRRLFSDELFKLSMALFSVFGGAGWLPVTIYTLLLMFSATCQYLFLWFANISTIAWTFQDGTLQDDY